MLFFLVFAVVMLFRVSAKELPATLRYNLDLRVDYANEKVFGKCEITLSNDTDKPLNQVPFLLYRLLYVKYINDEHGNPLPYAQTITNISGWEQLQVNLTELSLNIVPGEKKTIVIGYEGFVYGYSDEGWRYVRDHIARDFTIIRTDGFGYPVIGHPDGTNMMAVIKESYDYTLNVTIPKDLTAVCGGKLTSVIENGDEKTVTFQSKKPSWRIDVAIADYKVIEKNMNKIFCFKSDTAGARSMIDALEKTIETYSGWFGEIRDYQGYTIVEVPQGYGSQADVASFYLMESNFKTTKENPGIYHEIAHLWDVKPAEDNPCRFESEGRAQFLQFLLPAQINSNIKIVHDAAQKYLDDIKKDFTAKPEYQDVPVKNYGISDMTEYSYTLGMVVFALFYDLAGEKHFNNAIRSYFSGYSGKRATLNDFTGCCIKNAPFDARKFFDDWIYSTSGVGLIVKGYTYEDLRSAYR